MVRPAIMTSGPRSCLHERQRTSLRVAIVGGGDVALFTALGVRHHVPNGRVHTKVHEEAALDRAVDAGIEIRPNAAKLHHERGIADQLNKISH